MSGWKRISTDLEAFVCSTHPDVPPSGALTVGLDYLPSYAVVDIMRALSAVRCERLKLRIRGTTLCFDDDDPMTAFAIDGDRKRVVTLGRHGGRRRHRHVRRSVDADRPAARSSDPHGVRTAFPKPPDAGVSGRFVRCDCPWPCGRATTGWRCPTFSTPDRRCGSIGCISSCCRSSGRSAWKRACAGCATTWSWAWIFTGTTVCASPVGGSASHTHAWDGPPVHLFEFLDRFLPMVPVRRLCLRWRDNGRGTRIHNPASEPPIESNPVVQHLVLDLAEMVDPTVYAVRSRAGRIVPPSDPPRGQRLASRFLRCVARWFPSLTALRVILPPSSRVHLAIPGARFDAAVATVVSHHRRPSAADRLLDFVVEGVRSAETLRTLEIHGGERRDPQDIAATVPSLRRLVFTVKASGDVGDPGETPSSPCTSFVRQTYPSFPHLIVLAEPAMFFHLDR